MTEQQRTLSGYKSKITEPGDFDNPNEGKEPLTEFDEYIFRLDTFPHVKTFKQLKTRKDGSQVTEEIEKAICEFIETKSGNIATAFFRVDKLNFAEDDSYRSAIIRFFHRIGHPLQEGVEPDWNNYFVVGMRFRSRVVLGMDVKDGKKVPNHKYYIDVPTCRPLLPSDKENAAPGQQTITQERSATLANALLLVKGATNGNDALAMLQKANAPQEMIREFFNANLDGKVSYPI